MSVWVFRIVCAIAALGAAVGIAAFVTPGTPASDMSSAYVIAQGVRETGAINLVTAIYLGYRAFDTLGETIVLFLAVSGAVHLLRRHA